MVRRAVLNQRKREEAQLKANQPKEEKRPKTPRGKYFRKFYNTYARTSSFFPSHSLYDRA